MPNIAILLAAAATMLAPTAPAQPAPHIKIAAHDFDLTTAKRRQTPMLRIARAASQLCEGVDGRPRHSAAGLAIDSLRKTRPSGRLVA
jgi:UrcA family protein